VKKEDIENYYFKLAGDLNTYVFPKIDNALTSDPSIRTHLNPAFPFPMKIRAALLDTHLAVEYVGPEDNDDSHISIEGVWQPTLKLLDFLGIDLAHISAPRLPWSTNLENMQVFLGEAMNLLGDYLYDVVSNPQDLILNGIPEFGVSHDPTYVSNTTFLWSDAEGAIRIRRIDFLELFPIQKEGWAYHTKESLEHFADFLINYQVPTYSHELHAILNDFIQLIAQSGTDEPTITKYLEKHPEILQISFGTHELNPQTDLIWQYSTDIPDLKPDFMPVKMDGFADILEFKLPRLKSTPLVGSSARRHPSFEIDSALAQIDQYEDWVSQDINRQWLEATKSIKIMHPHIYLVIGHREEFNATERQKLRGRRNATIFTYDEFIEMARMQLYRLR
jgi:hypothetical protein